VAWPTRPEVVRYSIIVTICVLVYMVFVSGIDFGLSQVAEWFYG
jgi:preprotein translocase subunit SecE